MARVALGLVLAGLLVAAAPAAAVICTIDAVPAATLLLPYFEVDLNNPNGLTTLFSVNNASATAVLVHTVIWSDLSVPVLDFNIYLTGYDVQSVNLRDIIVDGNLPQTASAGQDPTDTISPKGSFSQDINFASCTGKLPPPALPAFFIAHLEAALTGNASAVLKGDCAGQLLGDNVARGYVTMDTVNNCSLRFPGDAGYFAAGGTGDVTNQNVLWGDWFIVNAAENFAEGSDLVHIEAAPGVGVDGLTPTNPATTTSGRYTFYGRYDAWTAVDNREPLATEFAARYLNGGPFSAGTSLLVWRDSKVNQGPFTCPATAGVQPPWYPLGQEAIVIFDEQEHPSVPQTFPFSPQPPNSSTIPFPAETQRTQVGGASFPLPAGFDFGWLFLDLNTTVAAAGNNPPVDPAAAQAWVVYTLASNGQFGVGIDAIRLDSACAASHFFPGEISSSLRFKQDVADMAGASDDLLKLRPVTFRYQPVYDDGSNVLQYGLIAEEVAKVYPGMVQLDSTGKPLAVRYNFLDAMMLEQVQKQHATIAEQAARIEAQQRQIDDLTKRQAAVDALRDQLERLAQTVKAQQEAMSRQR
ncbi:MAG TPA: tail fiber domain-containing protein [Thermoanaerobaculia bacterium]|nr:tail fiber domain-containing protein [Thermoanaerobaculia bacterium]